MPWVPLGFIRDVFAVMADTPQHTYQILSRFRLATRALNGELVGDEPVAELRVVVVDVDRGVDQVRVVPRHPPSRPQWRNPPKRRLGVPVGGSPF
jgi:protein gp37